MGEKTGQKNEIEKKKAQKAFVLGLFRKFIFKVTLKSKQADDQKHSPAQPTALLVNTTPAPVKKYTKALWVL